MDKQAFGQVTIFDRYPHTTKYILFFFKKNSARQKFKGMLIFKQKTTG